MKDTTRHRALTKAAKTETTIPAQKASSTNGKTTKSSRYLAYQSETSSEISRDTKGIMGSDEIVQKIVTLRERGKALGLKEEEIRAYLDPIGTPRFLVRYVPKIHIYKAHFVALWRRGLLWSTLKTKRMTFVKVCLIMIVSLLTLKALMATLTSLLEDECLVQGGSILDELVRPLFPCEVCQNLTHVPQVTSIEREEFVHTYAYSGVPVLVKAAAQNWKAVESFSFEYFKSLYLNNTAALEVTTDQCQFFQYNTEFETLEEALSMEPDRAAFKEGQRPWYIGWSNCDPEIADVLRSHYDRPYFLPEDAESSPTDWIFMGGSGVGAGVHIDRVNLPSWQAQVSGTKTWSIIPSPECSSVCHNLEVTVHKGDIIVVDTNVWYHSTFVHPGEISITIGSEYD